MSNMMAALSNIGSALCSTPQIFADAHYYTVTALVDSYHEMVTCLNIIYKSLLRKQQCS